VKTTIVKIMAETVDKKLPQLPPKRTSSLNNDVPKDKKPSAELVKQLEESSLEDDQLGTKHIIMMSRNIM
jgi:hypothetical protein